MSPVMTTAVTSTAAVLLGASHIGAGFGVLLLLLGAALPNDLIEHFGTVTLVTCLFAGGLLWWVKGWMQKVDADSGKAKAGLAKHDLALTMLDQRTGMLTRQIERVAKDADYDRDLRLWLATTLSAVAEKVGHDPSPIPTRRPQ